MCFAARSRVIVKYELVSNIVLRASNPSHGDANSWFRAKSKLRARRASRDINVICCQIANATRDGVASVQILQNQGDRVCSTLRVPSEYNIPSMPHGDRNSVVTRLVLSATCRGAKFAIRSKIFDDDRNYVERVVTRTPARLISHFGFHINNSLRIRSWYFFSACEIYSVKVVSNKSGL